MNAKKLEIGICDDQPRDLKRIRDVLCSSLEAMGGWDASIHLFRRGRALCEESKRTTFGLLFLDVMMPDLSGFDLASQIHMHRGETKVVFVSNHENMVFDSYDFSPLWFVRKSLLERDMSRALIKYRQATSERRITYRIKEGFGRREVMLDELMYIECEKHTLKLSMSDGNVYQAYGSLRPVEEELSESGFIRIHKSYLVNQRYISEVCKRSVRLRNGSELDMGRARRKEIADAMMRYERGKTT